jgi:hypothetical protein
MFNLYKTVVGNTNSQHVLYIKADHLKQVYHYLFDRYDLQNVTNISIEKIGTDITLINVSSTEDLKNK